MRTVFLFFLLFQSLCTYAATDGRPTMRALPVESFFGGESLHKVDINLADADEISEKLKGIGTKKAQAIVEYRNQHGDFRSLRELEQVKGIGPALVQKNRHLITVVGKQRSAIR
jgi:competence ComEA-like helix-hairpin-helix protein